MYSFCCRCFIYFRRAKVAKRPAHGPSSRSLLCSRCCRATSLVPPSLAAASLSAVCRVLRNALRAAILKKYNCRPTFERSSHNGLHTSGLSAVSVTVPVLFLELPLCAGEVVWRCCGLAIRYSRTKVTSKDLRHRKQHSKQPFKHRKKDEICLSVCAIRCCYCVKRVVSSPMFERTVVCGTIAGEQCLRRREL